MTRLGNSVASVAPLLPQELPEWLVQHMAQPRVATSPRLSQKPVIPGARGAYQSPLRETVFESERGRGGAAAFADLLIDVGDVAIHRGDRQHQVIGNLLAGQSASHPAQHFHFGRRQL